MLKKITWKCDSPPDFPYYVLPAVWVQYCVMSQYWLQCHSPDVTHPVFPMHPPGSCLQPLLYMEVLSPRWSCTCDQDCSKHNFLKESVNVLVGLQLFFFLIKFSVKHPCFTRFFNTKNRGLTCIITSLLILLQRGVCYIRNRISYSILSLDKESFPPKFWLDLLVHIM